MSDIWADGWRATEKLVISVRRMGWLLAGNEKIRKSDSVYSLSLFFLKGFFMNTNDIIKIITDCAILYKKNLCNKNFLFATKENAFEVLFNASNYMHLTGVKRSGNYFVPNTALEEDIRKIAVSPALPILFIASKQKTEKSYNNIIFHSKDFNAAILSDEIKLELNALNLINTR